MDNQQTEHQTSEPVSPAGQNCLYSMKEIMAGTLFGGLIATGMMARKNFSNLGQESAGRFALALSLLGTALMFGLLFLLPESIVDAIPSSVLPAIYCAIAYKMIEAHQGKALKQHERAGAAFYSGWRVFGVSLASLFITFAMLLVTMLALDPNLLNNDSEAYNEKLDIVVKQEDIGLGIYPLLESGDKQAALKYIDEKALPAWKTGLKELQAMEKMSVEESYQKQAQDLQRYVKLRIESLELLKKSLVEETDQYDERIKAIMDEINKTTE